MKVEKGYVSTVHEIKMFYHGFSFTGKKDKMQLKMVTYWFNKPSFLMMKYHFIGKTMKDVVLFLEEVMFRVLKIGSAFIGIIVGAGFASGQEILQYFTSFGYLGTIGAVFSAALFAYLGMMLTRIGSQLQTTSHKDAIYQISGKYLGFVVDAVIVFTLFGVGVVMVAGSGSMMNQQFGLPPFVGSLILIMLITATMFLKIDKVVGIIGSITPFLILAIVVIAVYSLFTMDKTFAELNPIALEQTKTLPNWFVSAINYASFNIAVGAGMSIVMGGAEKDQRIASLGGFVGGLGIGILILLAHLSIFSRVNVVGSYELPLLKIFDEISPVLSTAMAFVLFGMIFNTGISMFYGFVARFFDIENKKKAFPAILITCLLGFVLSFVGFTSLVSKVYNFIGYAGLFLILALLYAPFKLRKDKEKAV